MANQHIQRVLSRQFLGSGTLSNVLSAIADATPRTARRLIEIGFGFAAQDGRRHLTPADIAKARRHVSLEPKHARFGFHPAK